MSLLFFLFFALRISYSDIKTHTIKNRDVSLFIFATLIFGEDFISGAYLLLIFLVIYLLPTGLGFGDVKLSFPVGTYLRLKSTDDFLEYFLVLSIFATMHCIIRSVLEKRFVQYIPLAPSIFLAAGVQLAARTTELLSH